MVCATPSCMRCTPGETPNGDRTECLSCLGRTYSPLGGSKWRSPQGKWRSASNAKLRMLSTVRKRRVPRAQLVKAQHKTAKAAYYALGGSTAYLAFASSASSRRYQSTTIHFAAHPCAALVLRVQSAVPGTRTSLQRGRSAKKLPTVFRVHQVLSALVACASLAMRTERWQTWSSRHASRALRGRSRTLSARAHPLSAPVTRMSCTLCAGNADELQNV
eukprot:SAG11_NODE_458_length_9290_cov_2.641388_7_plen_218_part_00